jgi:hypothetical protein
MTPKDYYDNQSRQKAENAVILILCIFIGAVILLVRR